MQGASARCTLQFAKINFVVRILMTGGSEQIVSIGDCSVVFRSGLLSHLSSSLVQSSGLCLKTRESHCIP